MDEFMMSLDCEPSELADPEVRASVRGFASQLEAAGVSTAHHMYFRSGAVMASVTSLGPYLLQLAPLAIPALAAVWIAWIKAAPGRRVRVKIGDTRIEANSVEDVERLVLKLEQLQANTKKRAPKA